MRFPEFKGEWRRLSIEDVAEVIGGGTPDTRKPDFWDGKIQWFTPTEVGKQKYVISSKRTITELGLSSSSAKLLPRGSILLATRATIGPASISMNPNGVTTNQGFQSLVPKDIEDIEFLYYVIERPEIQKEMNRRSSGSTFNEISHSQVSSIRIGWPSKEERQKISTFLAIIDRRIDVQRKTIEERCALKGVLQEDLFKDFKSRQTLKDAVQSSKVRLYRGKVIPKHAPDEQFKYPVYSSSQENYGLMGYWDTYMLDEELISWSIDGGGKFFYRPKHKFNITNVCGYIKLDPSSYDYYYCFLYLDWQFKRMHFDYVSKAHPSVIQTLYYLPTISKRLQISISEPFRIIDRSIEIESRSLTMLMNLKQYLLNSLFC